MKKAFLIALCVLFGTAQLHASATGTRASGEDADTSPVMGHSHKEQFTYFKSLREEEAARLIPLPCHTCNDDKYHESALLKHRLDPLEDGGSLFSCEGGARGPYCCAAVAYQADLLKIQQLSGQVRERLDLLAKAYVPHSQKRLDVLKVDKMLYPLLEAFAGWEKMQDRVTRELVYCRAVFGYFSKAFVEALAAHPDLEELSFVSKGIHPLLLPALEAFAAQGRGPSSLSFGRRHLCKCTDKDRTELNTVLRRMPFVTQIIYGDVFSGAICDVSHTSKCLSTLVTGTGLTRLFLEGSPRDCCLPIHMGHELFQGRGEEWCAGCKTYISVYENDFKALQNGPVTFLSLRNPAAGDGLMMSKHFGAYLKQSSTLRTLELCGQAYGQGRSQSFVDSVLGSTSLTSVLFKGTLEHRSFGLSDAQRETIEAHLAQNRQAQESGPATSSS